MRGLVFRIKRPSVILLSILAILAFTFQNCARAKFFPAAENPGAENQEDSSSLSDVKVPSYAAVKITMVHSPNRRDFSISSLNLVIVDSNCKIQYQKNGESWTDFSEVFECNTDLQNQRFFLPSEDGWTNNFNSTGVRIRIVRATDSKVVSMPSQNLVCAPKSIPSPIKSPDIDENCNGKWDDPLAGNEKFCEFDDFAGVVIDNPYTCAPEAVCSNSTKTAKFKEHTWKYSASVFLNLNCDGFIAQVEQYSAISVEPSGTVPKTASAIAAGCFNATSGMSVLTQDTWSQSKCRYSYHEDPTYF